MVEYLKAIGIKATSKVIEFGLWQQLGNGNTIKASIVWVAVPEMANAFPTPGTDFGPNWAVAWGPAWRQWYDTDGKSGTEPPPEVKALFDLDRQIPLAVTPSDRQALMNKVLDSFKENVWVFGLLNSPRAIYYNAKLMNVAPDAVTKVYSVHGAWRYSQFWFYGK